MAKSFDKHIFVCTNERVNSDRCSCGEHTGRELVAMLKKRIKEEGLNMRAQRAGCIDACDDGPAIVVYPEGVFYGRVEPEDIDEIFEEHLKNNRVVERKKI